MPFKFIYFSTLVIPMLLFSCKKTVDAHVPPNVVFNQDTLHTYQDGIAGLQDTLLVGLTATKTEDDLKSFNASVAYDGANTTSTFYNYFVTPAEYLGFTKEIQIITRNQAGTERWVFSIVDRDGNITQKTFTLTVQ